MERHNFHELKSFSRAAGSFYQKHQSQFHNMYVVGKAEARFLLFCPQNAALSPQRPQQRHALRFPSLKGLQSVSRSRPGALMPK